MEYSIQYYQKKHKNEYVIKSKKGDCCLYKNGLLKMIWKEDVDGNRMGEFVSFDKGKGRKTVAHYNYSGSKILGWPCNDASFT